MSHPDDVRKVLDVALQRADGLAAAHAAGFTHRDLKPANLLLGRVNILDFGIAKRTGGGASDDETQFVLLSAAGSIAGTPAYMSPGQARGQTVDFRTDQLSFGLVGHEMLTGQAVLRRPSTAETMTAIIREDPEPLPPTTPAALHWTVERYLAKDPEQRYDSTRDLYRELRQIRDNLTEGQSAIRSVAPPRRRNAWRAMAAAALLAWGRTSPDTCECPQGRVGRADAGSTG